MRLCMNKRRGGMGISMEAGIQIEAEEHIQG
jgi:hypothetical protein